MKTTPSLSSRLLFGLLLTATTTALYLWKKDISLLHPKVINSNLLVLLAYSLATISINTFISFPGKRGWLHILPTIGIAYSFVFGIFASLFITFSNSFVLVNGILASLFFVADTQYRRRNKPTMAFIALGRAEHANTLPHVHWYRLDSPKLPQKSLFSAVVADLHSTQLDASWQKFLADCTLKGISVYNIRQIEESLTGRVKIHHLYENDLGSLLPSPAYMMVKRILDILIVLTTSPITLLLMLGTALAVRLDSPGPVLFT